MRFRTSFVGLTVVGLASVAHAATLDEFNDNTQAWNTFSFTLTEAGGILNAVVTSGDVNIFRNDFTNFEGDVNPYIHINMRVDPSFGTSGQVFFTGGGGGYNEPERRGVAGIINDGAFHTYVVDMTGVPLFQKRIGSIRFDVSNSNPTIGDDADIDWIRVSPSATNSNGFNLDRFSDGNAGFWSYNGYGTTTESSGILASTSTTSDPMMNRDTPDFSGNMVSAIKVTMAAAEGAGDLRVYWNTVTLNFATEAQAIGATLIADGLFHEYLLDVSGIPTWTNEIITGFRFDPVSASGIAFQIDSIELIAVPEPATFSLLGLAALVLVRRRLR